MSSITNNIPSDIWGDILVRLPAECVIRARAVNKGWRAVIDGPCFVRAHTNNHQQQQSSSSKIIFQNKKIYFTPFFGSCYSLDLEALKNCSNGQQTITATPLDLDFIRESPHGLSFRLAECNGLVLTQYPAMTIWNPLTCERLELPPARVLSEIAWSAFGLGYDSAADDYKAVVIPRSRETHVYSLKSDSWTRIMNCPAPRVAVWQGLEGPGVFVCGGLNWLFVGKDHEFIIEKIVALDLGTEKYTLLQMPRHKPTFSTGLLLSVLGGRLALCDSVYGSHLDVWAMKVYGHDDSWSKLFSIENEQNIVSPWSGYLMPAAFIMKEKLLVFLHDRDERFFLFDVETESFKSVKIDGPTMRKDSYLYAKQMFVGSIFRLHANCGGGGVRKSCTNNKKKNASAKKDTEFVFCIRDAKRLYKDEHHDSCSKWEYLSSENEDGTKLEANCSNDLSSTEQEESWFKTKKKKRRLGHSTNQP